MSSKHFIWIVRVSLYLWQFSWNFVNFLSTFRALKTFSSLYWNCFRIEKKFRNIKGHLIPSVWAEPEGPTYLRGPSPRPAYAHLGPELASVHGRHDNVSPPGLLPWRACHVARAYKGCGPVLPRALAAASTPRLAYSCRVAPRHRLASSLAKPGTAASRCRFDARKRR
jgi:hypothetical protein